MQFDVLKKDAPILGHRLLEASAGTGKTFAIEHLVLRLLCLESDPLSLEQILVVTFTKAAARELKLRIRANLENALHFLQNPKTESALYQYLPPNAQDKLVLALQNYEKAQIFTIHGFCLKTLREFAFESGLSLGDTNPSEASQGKLLEFAKDFLRTMKEDLCHPSEIACLMEHNKKIDKLAGTLLKCLEKGIHLTPPKPFAAFYADFQKAALEIPFNSEEKLLWEDFETLLPSYKITGFKGEDFAYQIELLAQLGSAKEAVFSALVKNHRILDFLQEDNLKKNASKEKKILHYPGFFTAVQQRLYPLMQEAASEQRIFLALAYHLEKNLLELYEKEGVLTPDEILRKMGKASGNAAFVKQVKAKYRAAIIDEFQDTDPLQWSIFQQLFLSHPATDIVYLVGDPKQSIYGFRKADVYTYLKAANYLGQGNQYTLQTNYRSTPSLVASLNAFFEGKLWLFLPKKGDFLIYHPVQAGRPASQEEGPPMHFFIAKGERNAGEIEQHYFFPFIANEILALLEKGAKLGDFAILVKDRYQAQDAQAFLQSCGLACTLKSQALLTETRAFRALKEMIKAACDPHDASRIKIALMGPFIDLHLTQIQEMAEEIPAACLAPFFALKNVLQKEGLAAFFTALLQTVWEKPVMTMLAKDPNLFQEIMQLFEFLLESAQKKEFTLETIEDYLDELETLTSEDRLKKQASSDEEAIQIMTIHASKGLEFGVVFALGLAFSSENKEDPFLNEKERVAHLQELDAEKLRQLYVAMTRAKQKLYVPFIWQEKQDAKKIPPMQLFFTHKDPAVLPFLEKLSLNGHLTYSFLQEQKKPKQAKAHVKVELEEPSFTSRPKKRSLIYSFSSLANKEKSFAADSTDGMPRGTAFGVFMHRIFEILFSSPFTKEKMHAVIQKELSLSPFQAFEKRIADLVEKACYTPLFSHQKGFYLANIPFQDLMVEMEFFSPLQRQEKHYLKGFIDLFFAYEGKYYLLDWKTNDLGVKPEHYSPESLHDALHRENYFLQAAIYTDALQKYLRIAGKEFSEVFGGMFYIFLRGLPFQKGIYHFLPDTRLIGKVSL